MRWIEAEAVGGPHDGMVLVLPSRHAKVIVLVEDEAEDVYERREGPSRWRRRYRFDHRPGAEVEAVW